LQKQKANLWVPQISLLLGKAAQYRRAYALLDCTSSYPAA
jgi:hypothetical protein